MNVYILEINYQRGAISFPDLVAFGYSWDEAQSVADTLFPGGVWEQKEGVRVLAEGHRLGDNGGYYPVRTERDYLPVFSAHIREYQLGTFRTQYRPATEADRLNPELSGSDASALKRGMMISVKDAEFDPERHILPTADSDIPFVGYVGIMQDQTPPASVFRLDAFEELWALEHVGHIRQPALAGESVRVYCGNPASQIPDRFWVLKVKEKETVLIEEGVPV